MFTVIMGLLMTLASITRIGQPLKTDGRWHMRMFGVVTKKGKIGIFLQ